MLRAFTSSDVFGYLSDPLVEKLANYVAGGGQSSPYDLTSSGIGLVSKALALSTFDKLHNSNQPHLDVQAESVPQDRVVLAGNISNASQPALETTFPYSHAGGPVSLSFKAIGKGEASFVRDVSMYTCI